MGAELAGQILRGGAVASLVLLAAAAEARIVSPELPALCGVRAMPGGHVTHRGPLIEHGRGGTSCA